MVQMKCLVILPLLLAGCSSIPSSTTIQDYCLIASRSHPILLSLKDTTQTKRQVAKTNATYEGLCKDAKGS